MDTPSNQELTRLFGLYKAEWLNGQLFELFTEPAYFPELRSARPCVLIGGRGTGKTTVLRGLSYEGQFALQGKDPAKVPSWQQFAVYYRVNPNRVTAFQGPELTDAQWEKCFAHYMNLLLCSKLVGLLKWFTLHTGVEVRFASGVLDNVCAGLHITTATSTKELGESLDRALVQFEASINNIGDGIPPAVSIQGAPVDALTSAIVATPEFAGKTFAFLFDEYENLLDYQQRVVNTLIKHGEGPYTFKIGVRELGWRVRETLNKNERLVHPADYQRINIGEQFDESTFRTFAERVCNFRLQRAMGSGDRPVSIAELFPRYGDEEEALHLGVREVVKSDLEALGNAGDADLYSIAISLDPLRFYFLKMWASGQGLSLADTIKESRAKPEEWNTRYDNYKHSMLFAIRKGKRGIRKHYAGWEVFCLLAAGNVRYLLELVHQSLLVHIDKDGLPGKPISPEHQTVAAERVGKQNLTELEGVSVEGARLTKLLLSLGRIFQVMAADPVAHTPEVNQFYVSADTPDRSAEVSDELERLLRSAVMHLALVWQPGSKLVDEADTREYDFMVHPIFAPFFVFSHRRKRKMKLTPEEILGLVHDPAASIRGVLAKSGRTEESELPDQLLLFQGFFNGAS